MFVCFTYPTASCSYYSYRGWCCTLTKTVTAIGSSFKALLWAKFLLLISFSAMLHWNVCILWGKRMLTTMMTVQIHCIPICVHLPLRPLWNWTVNLLQSQTMVILISFWDTLTLATCVFHSKLLFIVSYTECSTSYNISWSVDHQQFFSDLQRAISLMIIL